MDASFKTNIIMGRTVFANVLTKQAMINAGIYKSAAKLTAGGGGASDVTLSQATGGVFTSPAEFATINGFITPPPSPTIRSASYNFPKSTTNYGYLSVANSPDFSMGTGDFTIEWYQYLQTPNSFPRIFSMGSYANSITMGASIEDGNFYFWINNSPLFGVAVSTVNAWTHFAVVRFNGSISVYKDGTPISAPITNNANMVDIINDLTVGNESAPSYDASFSGKISNFRIIKGNAFYRNNFIPSSSPLPLVTGTVLLLNASNPQNLTVDASGKVVVNTNVTWDAASPFF